MRCSLSMKSERMRVNTGVNDMIMVTNVDDACWKALFRTRAKVIPRITYTIKRGILCKRNGVF